MQSHFISSDPVRQELLSTTQITTQQEIENLTSMDNVTNDLLIVNCPWILSTPYHINGSQLTGSHCPATIDRLNVCWNATPAGTWAIQPCPSVLNFDTKETVRKFCTEDGTWYMNEQLMEWADYSRCTWLHSKEVYIAYVYFAGYALSAICLTISLAVFCVLRQLQCDRITLHKNLFLCYLCNALSWIGYYLNLLLDRETEPACLALHFIATYFSAASYFWMFSEGIYLAILLQCAFSRGKLVLYICYFCGWGLPLVLTVVYVVVRSKLENPTHCWREESNLINITLVPALLALMANFVIILFILRVLIRKLRAPSSREERQTSKTAKAVFILVPLLGLYNIIFLIHPGPNVWGTVHDYATCVLTSTQGTLVSFLLCFANSEVLSVCQRRAQQRTFRSRHSIFSLSQQGRRDTCTSDLLPLHRGSLCPGQSPATYMELRSMRRNSRQQSHRRSSRSSFHA